MDRRQLLAGVGIAFAGANLCAPSFAGNEAKSEWEGSYLKFVKLIPHKMAQFESVPTVTIKKMGENEYTLGKMYADRVFKEVEKGVLSDGEGGLGKLYFGSVEFAGGFRAKVLGVDFCYEDFILYREVSDIKK